jgi:transcriptional regulator with XRE-family HTH domain
LYTSGAHAQDRRVGPPIDARELEREIGALAAGLGRAARAERERRRITVRDVAAASGLSYAAVHAVETGRVASLSTYVRLARALHLKPEFSLADPRRRLANSRAEDPVHAAMGEMETARLRGLGFEVRLDEPFAHYHFAGRGDVVAWSLERLAFLHIENRTRFPNLQEAFGAFSTKREYMAAEIAGRVGVRRWRSETHVMAMLWSAEVLRAVRQHRASFQSIDSDGADVFGAWWSGGLPEAGRLATAILLDPQSSRRRDAALWIGIADLSAIRPRYRGYADALAELQSAGQA